MFFMTAELCSFCKTGLRHSLPRHCRMRTALYGLSFGDRAFTRLYFAPLILLHQCPAGGFEATLLYYAWAPREPYHCLAFYSALIVLDLRRCKYTCRQNLHAIVKGIDNVNGCGKAIWSGAGVENKAEKVNEAGRYTKKLDVIRIRTARNKTASKVRTAD